MLMKFCIISFLYLLSGYNKPDISFMPLKYQDEIDKFSPTEEDWKEFEPIDNKLSFRWVFSNINDERNFKPRYSFPEVLELAQKRNKLTYKGWALSFNNSLEQSAEALKNVTKNKKELYKKLGTHIAMGLINSIDGVTEIECDSHGHFNHFEYEGTNFHNKGFEIVEAVIIL